MDVLLLQNVDQLGERHGDIDALFVLDAHITLFKHFLDDQRQIGTGLLVPHFAEIHKDGDKGRLSVCGQERDHLILDGLNAAAHLLAQPALGDLGDRCLVARNAEDLRLFLHLAADLLTRYLHKRRQMR